MPTPTLADIARQADLSLATVDRVMNDRPGVSERTRRRVLAAARTLGYLDPADPGPDPVRLAFILPEGTNAFVHELIHHIEEQAPLLENVSARVELVPGFDATALAERILALEPEVDGMAMLAVDHPIVREAVRDLVSRGMALATIGSDVRTVDHLGYVGIDDMQAGRLAGYLIGRLSARRSGKVAFFAGSLSYRGHQEREMGFRQILREEFPDLYVAEHREVQDSRAKAETQMAEIVARHPDLDAVYNTGGGTAGIATVLERSGMAETVTFIAHDATSGNKAFLLRGTLDAVIDQNARLEIRETLTTLVHAARGTPYKMIPPRLQIIFRENLPSA